MGTCHSLCWTYYYSISALMGRVWRDTRHRTTTQDTGHQLLGPIQHVFPAPSSHKSLNLVVQALHRYYILAVLIHINLCIITNLHINNTFIIFKFFCTALSYEGSSSLDLKLSSEPVFSCKATT